MHKRFTRAEKRQIVTNLFQRRNNKFISCYQEKKSGEAIADWQRTQKDLKAWLIDRVDEGLSEEHFFRLVSDNGWKITSQTIFEEDLLYGYAIELEDMYPDIVVEDQLHIEEEPEVRELKKEAI